MDQWLHFFAFLEAKCMAPLTPPTLTTVIAHWNAAGLLRCETMINTAAAITAIVIRQVQTVCISWSFPFIFSKSVRCYHGSPSNEQERLANNSIAYSVWLNSIGLSCVIFFSQIVIISVFFHAGYSSMASHWFYWLFFCISYLYKFNKHRSNLRKTPYFVRWSNCR